MGRSAVIFGVLLSVVLAGCVSDADVKTLREELETLKTKNAELDKELSSLRAQQRLSKFRDDAAVAAFLTPGSDGYDVIRTDLGSMTVSLKNIQAYANGSRITLQFGNLTSATINGAKATLEWGRVDKEGIPENDSVRSREVSFAASLQAGGWTGVPVVLDAVPSTELGFVRVFDVKHTGISLRK